MDKSESYVYFALKGDHVDPGIITERLGIEPTRSWRKGEKGPYNPSMKFSCWVLSTSKGTEPIEINNLVEEIIDSLYDKMDEINALKAEYDLNSVLEIIIDIDINPDESTPALGHDIKTIEFLYKTRTITDVDIYRYDSKNDNAPQQ